MNDLEIDLKKIAEINNPKLDEFKVLLLEYEFIPRDCGCCTCGFVNKCNLDSRQNCKGDCINCGCWKRKNLIYSEKLYSIFKL